MNKLKSIWNPKEKVISAWTHHLVSKYKVDIYPQEFRDLAQ